jgi:hypothetical protein
VQGVASVDAARRIDIASSNVNLVFKKRAALSCPRPSTPCYLGTNALQSLMPIPPFTKRAAEALSHL